MIRFRRTAIAKILAVGGIAIILFQTLNMAGTRTQLAIILVGIIINQIGVWGLAGRLLPERRSFVQLRNEADRFIDMVRQLNSQAVQADDAAVEQTKAEMHGAVDRMAQVAAAETDD